DAARALRSVSPQEGRLRLRLRYRAWTRENWIDPYASGRWFDGWSRPVSRGDPTESVSVAAATGWLLTRAWRKLGPIPFNACPGPQRMRPPSRCRPMIADRPSGHHRGRRRSEEPTRRIQVRDKARSFEAPTSRAI